MATDSIDYSSWIDLGDENQQENSTLIDNNAVTKLEFQLTESLYSKLKADSTNSGVSSGDIMYKDLPRMKSVLTINDKSIDIVNQLYEKHNNLILKSEYGNNYRQFLKQVFVGIFEHTGGPVPVDSIIEELITNCNQAGYDGTFHVQLNDIFDKRNLLLKDPSKKTISINCDDPHYLSVKYCIDMSAVEQSSPENEICKLKAVLEFTLEAQDNEKNVIYKNGKILLNIPKELKHYCANDKSLLNEIEEYFLDIEEYFLDIDNSIIESLIANVGDGPKSFIVDPTEDLNDEELSFAVVPKNLAFDRVVDILNMAIKEDNYEELNKIINDIEEDTFVADLSDTNLKSFCLQQLNLNLSERVDHQHIFHNILLQHRCDTENCSYLVKELILLAIAANDKLTEKYHNILFNQLILLPLFVGGQKYVQILSEKLQDNNFYRELDGKKEEKYELAKITEFNFFSAIALRQEFNKLFINYIPQHLEKILSSSTFGYAQVCAILKAAASTQNVECIETVLNSLQSGNIKVRKAPGISSTLLQFAIQFDYLETVKIILNHRFDVNNMDDYTKALHLAVRRGKLEIVQLLVEKGTIITDEIVKLAIKTNKNCIESQQEVLEDERKNSTKIAQFLIARYHNNEKLRNAEQEPITSNDNQNTIPLAIDTIQIVEEMDCSISDSSNELKASEEGSTVSSIVPNDGLGNENLELESNSSQQADDEEQQTINAYSEDGFTPLHIAAQKGDVEEGRRLIQRGANIEITSKAKGDCDTALHLAAREWHRDFVEFLLSNGANVNAISATGSGVTPLHEAAYSGHLSVIELLIACGATVDAKDRHNFTPLKYACSNNKLEAVKLLLQRKADPYVQDWSGKTILFNVACDGKLEMISILISTVENKEKYINVQNDNGEIVLHIIASKQKINEEHIKIVKLLLKNGADPYLKDERGQSALDIAKEQNNKELVPLFLPQQKRELSIIAASTLAVVGVISGMVASIYLEMLTIGIVVGACCLVAAAIIYFYSNSKPTSSIESSTIENVVETSLTAPVL